jgi:hypothetical protein
MVEPWLRGTLGEWDAVKRQVLHALELAGEDVERWCSPLTDEGLEMRPFGLASVGFQLRHIVRSLDRLLTYAEGHQLSAGQLAELTTEMMSSGGLAEFRAGLALAIGRVRGFDPGAYEEQRKVGRQMLPTTVGGLLVHCAEHTQRHLGQAIVTAKVVRAMEQKID